MTTSGPTAGDTPSDTPGETSGDGAAAFAAALQQFERDGDVEAFVAAVFADDVVLLRPETDQEVRGRDGARRFWTQYLSPFEQIRSEFARAVQAGPLGVLEWTSRGRLTGGRDIEYRGVSLLDLDGDGRVTRFATYFDTAAFTTTVAAPTR